MSVLVTIQIPKDEYSDTQAMMENVAKTISNNLNVAPQAVHVRIEEVPKNRFSIAGILYENRTE